MHLVLFSTLTTAYLKQSIHIDGRAGTGKTYLINAVINELDKREINPSAQINVPWLAAYYGQPGHISHPPHRCRPLMPTLTPVFYFCFFLHLHSFLFLLVITNHISHHHSFLSPPLLFCFFLHLGGSILSRTAGTARTIILEEMTMRSSKKAWEVPVAMHTNFHTFFINILFIEIDPPCPLTTVRTSVRTVYCPYFCPYCSLSVLSPVRTVPCPYCPLFTLVTFLFTT